jgi:hypothetical protein
MRPAAWLLAAAAPLTFLEFPLFFGELVRRSVLGTSLISARDLVLLAAAVVACVRLWRTDEDAAPVRGPSVAPSARPTATVR